MDRLSSYAQREAETESPEQRKKTEEESIAQLLEQMRIAKEKKAEEPEAAPAPAQNGDAAETQSGAEEDSAASSTTAVSTADTAETETTETDDATEKRRGIPNNVKLFEIFHEQVQTLVKMQRLPIQDTIGLLVSLANLAL